MTYKFNCDYLLKNHLELSVDYKETLIELNLYEENIFISPITLQKSNFEDFVNILNQIRNLMFK